VSGKIDASGVTYSNLNDNGDIGTTSGKVAPGDHTHSGYASQTDLDALETTVSGKIDASGVTYSNLNDNGDIGTTSGKVAPGDHTHDSRYYTESEIDSKLSGKADKSGAVFTGDIEINKNIPAITMNATSSDLNSEPHISISNSPILTFEGNDITNINGFVSYNFYSKKETERQNSARLLVYGSGGLSNTILISHYGGNGVIQTGSGNINLIPNGGLIYLNGTQIHPSDKRFKKHISRIEENTSEKLAKLSAYRFNYDTENYPDKNFPEHRQIGLLAQEVEPLFPEIVYTDEKGYKALDYEKFSMYLLDGFNEQQEEIRRQKNAILLQEQKINQLQKVIIKEIGKF
jgi:hypothetical protein